MTNESSISIEKAGAFIRKRMGHLSGLGVIFLALFPLRHVHLGLDLWDYGYNYANMAYAGLNNMDGMWYFSTYLSNIVGHLFSVMPGGGNLVGMNMYTGLIVSIITLCGYWFAVNKMQIPTWAAFLAGAFAEGLCWCPSALLYNYLTWLLLLAAVVLLYEGLTTERRVFFTLAGVSLGLNLFVRFSNLVHVLLILIVWGYGIFEFIDYRRSIAAGRELRRKSGIGRKTFYRTLLCMSGYMGAVAVMFLYIEIAYGLDLYIESIQRLFAMTDNATDYQSKAMVANLIKTYLQNLYWIIRIAAFAIAGSLSIMGMKYLKLRMLENGKDVKRFPFLSIGYAGAGLFGVLGMVWLLVRDAEHAFCSFDYHTLNSVVLPGIFVIWVTILFACFALVRPSSDKNERLLALITLLVLGVSGLGSNNGILLTLNNLFIPAAYLARELVRFYRLKETEGDSNERGLTRLFHLASPMGVRIVLAPILVLAFVQSFLFGCAYSFCEGTSVKDKSGSVTGSEILVDVRMSADRAREMQEIIDYINVMELKGHEAISYGYIPGIHYYLELPAAFNPWPDLASYSALQMQIELNAIEEQNTDETVRPIIVLENEHALFYEVGPEAAIEYGVEEGKISDLLEDEKWTALQEFMTRMEYKETFRNAKFAIFE